MSQDSGSLSRRNLLRHGGRGGHGSADSRLRRRRKASNSGTQGSGEGKITALFMQQAGYSEEDIRGMTADFTKANPKIR